MLCDGVVKHGRCWAAIDKAGLLPRRYIPTHKHRMRSLRRYPLQPVTCATKASQRSSASGRLSLPVPRAEPAQL